MPRVTLTFDNGPEPGVTEGVLDALAAAGVSATFFVIGKKVASPAGRRLATRAREAGHKIGNHTFTHSIPLGLADSGSPDAEIGATQRLLGDLAPERLFRPHGGGKLGPHLLGEPAIDYLVAGGSPVLPGMLSPGTGKTRRDGLIVHWPALLASG